MLFISDDFCVIKKFIISNLKYALLICTKMNILVPEIIINSYVKCHGELLSVMVPIRKCFLFPFPQSCFFFFILFLIFQQKQETYVFRSRNCYRNNWLTQSIFIKKLLPSFLMVIIQSLQIIFSLNILYKIYIKTLTLEGNILKIKKCC